MNTNVRSKNMNIKPIEADMKGNEKREREVGGMNQHELITINNKITMHFKDQ